MHPMPHRLLTAAAALTLALSLSAARAADTAPPPKADGLSAARAQIAQKKWAEEQGYTFPVLADNWPHGAVAKAYGIFNEAVGAANRATFVIDKTGAVVDTFQSENLGTPRGKESYEAALAKL